MGVAGQVCEYRFGTCEGAFGIDDPLALAQRPPPESEFVVPIPNVICIRDSSAI